MLILTKALGVGVLSAAFKQERLAPDGYAALIASTTQLNTLGAELAGLAGVHAVTDVTGFGLLGHALEMCRGAGPDGSRSTRTPRRCCRASRPWPAPGYAPARRRATGRAMATRSALPADAAGLAPRPLDRPPDQRRAS